MYILFLNVLYSILDNKKSLKNACVFEENKS
jgi:hypothetical protein